MNGVCLRMNILVNNLYSHHLSVKCCLYTFTVSFAPKIYPEVLPQSSKNPIDIRSQQSLEKKFLNEKCFHIFSLKAKHRLVDADTRICFMLLLHDFMLRLRNMKSKQITM